MRNPLPVLLLLVPAAWAAPKAGGHRTEDRTATRPNPDPNPLSLELPTLLLLQSAVRSLGLLERDAEAMTQEQALLYLFVLHDHDRSRRLDGLELLQLLRAVLAQQNGGQLDPNAVVVLVDRVLEKQDLSGDGLLDPPELLLWPPWGQGPPGQLLVGAEAAPEEDMRTPGRDTRVRISGHGPAEGQAAPRAEAPDAGAVEAEEAPQDEAPEGEAAPVWADPEEG